MVSILGDYSYTFPKPIPLKLKLKDMLEDNVDEKYYLNQSMLNYIFSEHDKYKVNINSLKINRDIACSKTTHEGRTRADTSDYIIEVINTYDEYNHKINDDETIGTIQAGYPMQNHGHRLIVKNTPKRGFLEATDGDGIDISSKMEHHRGVVNSDLRIRKLTPREVGRLMDVKDEDITKMLKNQSDASAFHCFGDSIVINVLMAIFKELLEIEEI